MTDDFGFVPEEEEVEQTDFGFQPEGDSMPFTGPQPGEGDWFDASGLMGASQGLLMNSADELGSIIGAGTEGIAQNFREGNLSGTSDDNLKKLYNEYLEFNRSRYKDAENRNPNEYLAGNLSGGAILPIGTLGSAAKGAKAVAGMAATGGALGGVAAAGASEAPVMSKEFAKEVGTGVGVGTVGGLVLPGALNAAGSAAKGLAGGSKVLGEKIFGPIGDAYQVGKEVGPLISPASQKAANKEIGQFAESIAPRMQKDIKHLAKLKNAISDEAEKRGVKINDAEIQSIIDDVNNFQPQSKAEGVSSDLDRLQGLLNSYKKGTPVQKQIQKELPSEIEKFRYVEELKRAEQEAIQSGVDPEDIETVFEAVDVPGKTAGVVRQIVRNKEGEQIGIKKLASKLVDENDVPQIKKVTETVYEDARNLSSPKTAQQLQKDIKELTKFGDSSIKSPEVSTLAGDATRRIRDAQRTAIPGLDQVDEGISAYNKAAEALGITDTRKIDEAKIRDRVLTLLNQEGSTGVGGIKATERFDSVISEIEGVNPRFAQQLKDDVAKYSKRMSVVQDLAKDSQITILNPLTLTRGLGPSAANLAGAAVGSAQKAVKRASGSLVTSIKNKSPEWMSQKAAQVAAKGGKASEELSRVLSEAAKKEERGRNAILFSLMQNPAYRKWLTEGESEDETK